MIYYSIIRNLINAKIELMKLNKLLPSDIRSGPIKVEPPRDPAHGDAATNIALVLAKEAKKTPLEIAVPLAKMMEDMDGLSEVSVAGPGFINMRLSDSLVQNSLREILQLGLSYGSSTFGAGVRINVEYVSANPTGPLHVGHARGAVFGDALANLLEKVGYSVTREYYINDAGAQVDQLARSLYLRYREALGEDIGEIPEGLYPGDYLKVLGKELAEQKGEVWRRASEEVWFDSVRSFAIETLMDNIREDLKALGVNICTFSSEREIMKHHQVERAIGILSDEGFIYEGVLDAPKGKKMDNWEARPQTLFRATKFGDDIDRPLRKSDGSWTYFATDMAYHQDKISRGFLNMINVWGADHGGYVKRMKAAVMALSGARGKLDVKICQIVKLTRGGEPVPMSKRSGQFVTLNEVVNEVGKDVVRFIMLTRRNDAPLEFDFVAVTDQSRDNPVFYVQYAHARACSILRKVAALSGGPIDAEILSRADLWRLTGGHELALIKLLIGWPELIENAAEAQEPHRLAFFVHELASAFHQMWNRGNEDPGLRFIIEEDLELTLARAALVKGVALVIASALEVMGIEPVEVMH